MLKGKWDYVFIEHLDDIVVGKDNTVRFIQVKSSEKVKMDASSSPASGLYYRTLIGESTDRKNNSWIDKLVSKAELLKKMMSILHSFSCIRVIILLKLEVSILMCTRGT